MTTTEGHDMTKEHAPLTDEELQQYRELIDMHQQYGPALSIEGEARLLAEVDRLRAELDDAKRLAAYYQEDRDATARFWEDSQAEVNRLEAELKAAKSTRFENNGVGDVAAHIQAETINDLRLN
jgi:uncharacterized small protein (DUF1192 family)